MCRELARGPIDELCAAAKDWWCGICGGTDPLGRVISDASKSEPGDEFAVAAGEGSGVLLLLCWNQPV